MPAERVPKPLREGGYCSCTFFNSHNFSTIDQKVTVFFIKLRKSLSNDKAS